MALVSTFGLKPTGVKSSIIPSFNRRDVVSSKATVSSAVALVSTFGVKPTGMFRLLHSVTSTWS